MNDELNPSTGVAPSEDGVSTPTAGDVTPEVAPEVAPEEVPQ